MNRKPFFAYRSFRKEFDAMREFHAAGVNQFCVFPAHSTNSLGEPYSEYPPTWLAPEVYDFASFDQQIEDVKKIAPNPEILCMVDLNSPSWLARRLNVAHCGPADSFLSLTDALSSPAWFDATRNYMESLIRHAEEKYGNLIQCYILACGTTDEWMDYSNGRESLQKLNRYREWVKARGAAEPECIPTYAQRFHAPHNGLRDPQQDADALRYWQFHSELVADSILRFAGAARALIPEGKEIGVFYGYVLELGTKRLVQAGHLACDKLLASDQIDFLISPGSYQDRELGGGVGIDLIHEWDYLCYLFGRPNRVYTLSGTYSDLEVTSDDLAVYIGQYDRLLVSLHLDYFGRCDRREVELYLPDDVVVGDLIRNEVRFLKSGETVALPESRDDYQKREIACFLDMLEGRQENHNPLALAVDVLKITRGETGRA